MRSGIFFQMGLDDPNQLDPLQQIRFFRNFNPRPGCRQNRSSTASRPRVRDHRAVIPDRFALFAKDFNGNLRADERASFPMQKSSVRSRPSLSVRIDLDPAGRIGPGKIQLLENIHANGSISAAGRAMDMSYKRAWDLVDEINRICRHPAVERQTAGKNRPRAALPPFRPPLLPPSPKLPPAPPPPPPHH